MSSNLFEIGPKDLQELMSKYKNRSNECEDLKYFEQVDPSEIFSKIHTDINKGISSIENREIHFGSNKIFSEPPPKFYKYLWESIKNIMIIILIIAAVLSMILNGCLSDKDLKDELIDGASIIVAILIVVLVSSITEYKKELKFYELNKTTQEVTKYKVIRNGQLEYHKSDEILVGDLILINYGDIMCADIILVKGHEIKMDESALTGRTDAMKKMPYNICLEENNKIKDKEKIPSPLILSGTNCIEGSGKGIVLAVGEYSQKGIIRRTVDNAKENNETPLELKLDRIGKMIGYFGIGAGVVTFIVFFIRYMVEYSYDIKEYNNAQKNGKNLNLENPKNEWVKNLLNIIILCISIIVLAVPEGLPLSVTLSLAFSVNKLMEHNNLVRKMHACETMGGANYICTDKTGTLTKNEISVCKILTGNEILELSQEKDISNTQKNEEIEEIEDIHKIQIREDHNTLFKNENYWELIKLSIALNVDCVINTLEKPDINGDIETCQTKNKIDQVFIDFLYRFKSPISIERNIYLNNEDSYKQFTFDSKRKRMSTLIKNSKFPTGYRLFSKGAGESSLQICSSYINPETGNIELLDKSTLNYIKNKMEEFNKNKLRTLYLAYKDITEEEYNNHEKLNTEGKLLDQYNMIFLGIFGIRDSLREGVKDAVEKCKIASVNVIMVTGDDMITSTVLAKECGILDNDLELNDEEIEKNPEKMNDKDIINKEEYIKKLIRDMPYVMTGNSFYNIIGGLICDNCKKKSENCKCPKTEAEAEQLAEKNNTEPKSIKKDKIKDLHNFKKIIKNLKVLVRSQPIHKYALVLGLKTLNYVVGVTGDGTNDAPALSKSDVGFAMFAGTDIAKHASDIIILDNNFKSVVTAIIYGRNIYDNIRKYFQFQLSTNFSACIIVFLCACIGSKSPLSSIQILWINLIMDSLGSMALATEPPYEDLLKRPPTKKNEFIINGKMWKHIILQSIVQILLLVMLYQDAPKFIKEDNLIRLAENRLIKYCFEKYPGKDPEHIIYGLKSKWTSDIRMKNVESKFCGNYKDSLDYAYDVYIKNNSGTTHMSIIYNVFIFYILFNQLNCRIIDDSLNIFNRIQNSIIFICIIILEIVLQIIIITFGGASFHIVDKGLSAAHWGICIGFSLFSFLVSIIAKFFLLDSFLENLFNREEKEVEFDPIAPEILECLDDKIRHKSEEKDSKGIETLNSEERDMISEGIDIKFGDNNNYDFNKKNNKNEIILVNEKSKSEENNIPNTNDKTSKNNDSKTPNNEIKPIESINININNIDNEEVINKKEEPPSKKYKIENLPRNIMDLPENYSTDEEVEYKFINLINGSNDGYELVVDSKTVKIYAKIVSYNI